MNKVIQEVTQRIVQRSKDSRSEYLDQMKGLAKDKVSSPPFLVAILPTQWLVVQIKISID